jgi:hypothetical protein
LPFPESKDRIRAAITGVDGGFAIALKALQRQILNIAIRQTGAANVKSNEVISSSNKVQQRRADRIAPIKLQMPEPAAMVTPSEVRENKIS